jgi:type III restriction enzyme
LICCKAFQSTNADSFANLTIRKIPGAILDRCEWGTHHARDIREFIESEGFFAGRYAGKVAEIHSKLTGDESDENAQRLLNIERDGQTEIVIHVNKLKEGWDVSNLYTIVPLRASASEILTEQTLGRGLRLPYGKRTGVEAVDTLTVIAHDRFNDIIERAKTADGLVHPIKQVFIGDGADVPSSRPVMIEAPSIIQGMIQRATAPSHSDADQLAAADGPSFSFDTPEEFALAETALREVLPSYQTKLSSFGELKTTKVIREIAAEALAAQRASEGLFKSDITPARAEQVIAELCTVFTERTIAIPQMVITPIEEVSFGFRPFRLEGLDRWNYQPLSRELLIQTLRTEKQSIISRAEGGDQPARLEDYIVLRLIDFPEVDYSAHAELLYDLAGQVVARLRSYLTGDEDVRNVLVGRGKEIADAIFVQMQRHMWRTETKYRVTLHAPFTILRPQAFDGAGADVMRDYRNPPERLSEIRRFIFTGFKKGCYWQAKFDSDTERKMAVLLERDPSVELWMKPGPNQFKIYDSDGHPYQPDFVVQTNTEKLIQETKRRSDLGDADVIRKANAAKVWCYVATEHHAKAHGEKSWRYMLIPDDAVQPNATLAGLLAAFSQEADMALRSQFELTAANG